MIVLPAGFTASPLADADINDVVTLVRACELHDSGEQMYERADLVADLVGADRELDALVVRGPGNVLAGWGLILRRRTRWSDVDPDHRGRRATCLSTDSNTGALPFYERLGMHVTRSFTHWAIPLGGGGRTP